MTGNSDADGDFSLADTDEVSFDNVDIVYTAPLITVDDLINNTTLSFSTDFSTDITFTESNGVVYTVSVDGSA